MDHIVKRNFLECLDTPKDFILIKKFHYKTTKRNELLFFIKPEFFLLHTYENRKAVLKLVLQKMEEFNIEISGGCLANGAILEHAQIMDRHYGYINKLSKNASKMIGEDEISEFKKTMPEFDENTTKIFGGHEYLKYNQKYNAFTLNALWLTHSSNKMRSGFYYHDYDIDGEHVVLVNGFHPSQLYHFTDPEHKIIVLLLHSNTDWQVLKDDFAGTTYPRKANPISVRGTLFHDKEKYGTETISIANNYIHLSAGPFEGFFELENFLTNIGEVHFDMDETRLAMVMKDKGLSETDFEKVLSNPVAVIDGKEIDLFTYTENKNSIQSVEIYMKYFKNQHT